MSSLKKQILPFPSLPREHLLHTPIRSSILCFGANRSSGFTEEELNYHEISYLVSNHAPLGGCWAWGCKPVQICSQEWWELNRVHRTRLRLLPPIRGPALQSHIPGGVSQNKARAVGAPKQNPQPSWLNFERKKKSQIKAFSKYVIQSQHKFSTSCSPIKKQSQSWENSLAGEQRILPAWTLVRL